MISIKHNIILYIQFSFYPYDTLWKAPIENPEDWGKSWSMGLFVSIVQVFKPDAVLPWTIFDTLSSMAPEHLAQMSSNVFILWYCQYFFFKHVHLKVGGKHKIWCNNKVKEGSVCTSLQERHFTAPWSRWQRHHCLQMLCHHDSYSQPVAAEHLKCVASQCELRCGVSIYANKYLLWAIVLKKKKYNIIFFFTLIPHWNITLDVLV